MQLNIALLDSSIAAQVNKKQLPAIMLFIQHYLII